MGDLRQTSPESGPGPRRARGEWHRITVEPLYVRAELFNRETLEETQKFLDDTVAAMAEHGGSRLLIYIVNAKPIFAVEKYGFSRYLDVALKAGYKIALVGSSRDLRIAHQYYAMLAQQPCTTHSRKSDASRPGLSPRFRQSSARRDAPPGPIRTGAARRWTASS